MPHPIAIAGRSDVGKLRRRNEDSFVVLPDLGIAVVADGMGGHPGGDVASRIAAETCAGFLGDAVGSKEAEDGLAGAEDGFVEAEDGFVEAEDGFPGAEDGFVGAEDGFVERFRGIMELAVLESHRRIRQHGTLEPHLEGMGTTLTAMITDPESGAWVIGHVGDSRAYRLRGDGLEQLTRDDTWVQEQIDRGEMQPETAKLSPYAHLLTQCVGLEDPPAVQLLDGAADPGDLYLLCTDGLVGMLDDARLTEILSRGGREGEDGRLEALVDAANEAGGHDNVTAALVRFT